MGSRNYRERVNNKTSVRWIQCSAINIRDGWVHQVKVTLEVLGDGVGQRADLCLASLNVRVHTVIGTEQFVGLAYGDAELKPVSCRADGLEVNVIALQPLVDLGDTVGRWLYVFLDLHNTSDSDDIRGNKLQHERLTCALVRCWP